VEIFFNSYFQKRNNFLFFSGRVKLQDLYGQKKLLDQECSGMPQDTINARGTADFPVIFPIQQLYAAYDIEV